MPFFSNRIAIGAGATVKILTMPRGVAIRALTIKSEGGILVLTSKAAATDGMTFTDGAGIAFSYDDLKCLTNEDKALYGYSAAGTDVEIFGVLEY